jgi:protease stability complex PrcB-like protein
VNAGIFMHNKPVARSTDILLRLPIASLWMCLFVLLSGCGPDSEVVSEGEYLYFEPIGMGQAGALTEVGEWVVRDSVSWVESSDLLSPLAPFKPVRFDQTVVVAVAIPEESGGYHVEIESVERTGEGILITYLLHEPAGDCITLVAPALPFQVVAVRRFEEENVTFVRRTQNYECTWRQN